MAENAAVHSIVAAIAKLQPSAHWQRIEDNYSPGIPDINVCWQSQETWIEAKFLESWPVRESTGIRIRFRPQQPLWAKQRTNAGGRVVCLLRIGGTGWAAFDAKTVDFFKLLDGSFNRTELLDQAFWNGSVLDMGAVLR
jgi:hypothetical protein